MAVGVYNVEEAYDVDIVHFFEEGDFADCRRRDAFIFGFQSDLFQCDDSVVGEKVASLVDDTVRAWQDECVSSLSFRLYYD